MIASRNIAGKGGGLQVRTAVAKILNKQLRFFEKSSYSYWKFILGTSPYGN